MEESVGIVCLPMPTPANNCGTMIFEQGIFSSAYAGSVRYYATMLACRQVVINTHERYHKAFWSGHHCRIVGANGVQTLTIPVLKPVAGSVITSNDLLISEHGDWRRVHWGALFSAYGKSPFFDYIADELRSIYENREITRLVDFNKAIHSLIIDFLDLPINIYADENHVSEKAHDFCAKVGGKQPDRLDFVKDVKYWQVWQERYGFIPDLSIFDLLMTQGRESVLVLRQMLEK